MSYVFWNIFWCLLAAFVFGGVIGWLIKHLLGRDQVVEAELVWQSKIDALESERDRLAAEARDGDEKLREAQAKYAGFETGLAVWEEEKAALAADAESWKRKAVECGVVIGDLENRLQLALAEDRADDAAYEQVIGELKASLAAAESERDNLAATLQQGQMTLRFEDDKALAELKAKLAAVESEREIIFVQLTDVRTDSSGRIAELESQVHHAVRRIEADEAAYRKKIEGLEAQLAAAEQRMAWADSAAKHLEQAAGDRKEWETAYTKEIAELKAELARTQQLLAKAEAADRAEDAGYEKVIGELKARLAASANEEEKMTAEREAFRTQLAAIASDRDSFQAQLTDFTQRSSAQTGELERQLAAASGELESLREANARLQAELGELKGSLTGVRRAREDAAEGEAAHKARVAELQARLERLIADDKSHDAAYEKRFTALRADLAQSHAETVQAAAESRAAGEAYEARIAALAAEVAAAEGLRKRAAELEAQLKKNVPGDIERIEGIGVAYGQRLRAAGIVWVRDLLARGASSEGRQQIVAQTGIKAELILTWVNAADLLRVDGITPDWAELLEAAGVDTVKELRTRVPASLLEKMTETNPFGPGGRFAPTLPELEEVECWIGQAKAMAPRVTH